MEAVARHHPDPYRSITREAFEREAERAAAREVTGSRGDAVCALMQLGAALGERNGHSGIFALDGHADPLRFYPLWLYEFDDGFFIVSAADTQLSGAEVLSVGGTAFASLAAQIEPLVPHDNHTTVGTRRPSVLLAAEVLDGLGIGESTRRTFVLRPPFREPFEVTLEPIPAVDYATAVDADPRLPRRRGVRYFERRDERVGRASRRKPRNPHRLQRHARRSHSPRRSHRSHERNRPQRSCSTSDTTGGGDNTTYEPLLLELQRQSRRHNFSY